MAKSHKNLSRKERKSLNLKSIVVAKPAIVRDMTSSKKKKKSEPLSAQPEPLEQMPAVRPLYSEEIVSAIMLSSDDEMVNDPVWSEDIPEEESLVESTTDQPTLEDDTCGVRSRGHMWSGNSNDLTMGKNNETRYFRMDLPGSIMANYRNPDGHKRTSWNS